MIALPIILVIITLIGVKFSGFHKDYAGLSQTTAVKGFFAVVIVMSHMMGYIAMTHPTELLYREIINYVGQLMVALFFFYSGYGVVVSYTRKSDYYDGFLRNRLLKVLVHFDLAVLLFAVMNLVLSIDFDKTQYITCWVGWGTIGNSNWFIFDTLIFYVITFVAMTIKEKTKTGNVIFASVISVLCLFFWATMALLKGRDASWWFDTVFCFPVGIWYGVLKDKIDYVAKKWYFYLPILAVLVGVFAFYYGRRFYYEYYSILAPIFCLLLTWVTMKVKFDNKILAWLGKHSFEIYIIQRIPMTLLRHFGLNKNSTLFAFLAVATVMVAAWLFALLLKRADKLMFRKK